MDGSKYARKFLVGSIPYTYLCLNHTSMQGYSQVCNECSPYTRLQALEGKPLFSYICNMAKYEVKRPPRVVHRAVSTAIHAPIWGHAVTGSRNSAPLPCFFVGLPLTQSFNTPKMKYEILEISEICINPCSILSCNL